MTGGRRRAFTLVELLVVIGIIALLISILLPVLGNVRKQGIKAKCAAQMRDLGNAMLMYAQVSKGFLPPVRINTPYNLDGIVFDKGGAEVVGKSINENAKWWNFLGKYITKKRTMAQSGQENAALRESGFWCPGFEGYVDTGAAVNLQGGFNRNATGIGMNPWPSFRAGNPAPNSQSDFPATSERFWDCLDTNASNRGTWYKLIAFTRPAERAMLGDGRQFYLEAKKVAASQAIPGQRLNFITADYSSGVSGQTTFDFYRHGTYPGIENPDKTNGYFRATGGKIAFNILYADGHVSTAIERETGYKACRLRFPD